MNEINCQNCKLHITENNYKDEQISCKCSENRIEHNYSCQNEKKYIESCIHCQQID